MNSEDKDIIKISEMNDKNDKDVETSKAIKRILGTSDGKKLLTFLIEKSGMLSIDRTPKTYAEECYQKGQREFVNYLLLYMDTQYIITLLQEKLQQDEYMKRQYLFGGQ